MSISSLDATPDSKTRTASSKYGTRSRFTTKPGVSLATTAAFPILSTNPFATSNAASFVGRARMISTSFMSGTGLKKWSPRTRSGRPVVAAISVIESEEVLLAKTAVGGTSLSRAWKTSRFASTFSTTASTTSSHGARSRSSVVPLMFASTLSRSSAVTFPFATPSSRNFRIRPRPLSRVGLSTSRTHVRSPAWALTCAIPEPMRPHPTTPTVFNAAIAFRPP